MPLWGAFDGLIIIRNNKMTEEYNGAIFADDEMIYKIGGEVNIDTLPTLHPLSEDNITELNQNEFADELWYALCTVYAPMGMLSDNTYIDITEKQRLELARKRSEQPDFNKNIWGYISVGVEIVASINNKLEILKVSTKTQHFFSLLGKNYRINIGLNIKESWNSITGDWVISMMDIDKLWKRITWHSTSIVKIWDKYYIVDNYNGVKTYNIIELEVLQKMIDDDIIYEWAYIIFLNTNNLKEKMQEEILNSIKLLRAKEAFKLWIWNGLDWKDVATREETAAMVYSMYNLIKSNGNE